MAISLYARFTIYLAIVCLAGIIILQLKLSTLHNREHYFGVSLFHDGVNHPNSGFKDTNSATQQASCVSLPAQHNQSSYVISSEWESSHYVEGPPTKHFRGERVPFLNGPVGAAFRSDIDNLREDEFYITGMANGGFTNQFISYVNMIYLGMISKRVPIIPAFVPHHHISLSAGAISFGHVFNISRARNEIKHPLLEWKDVKHRSSLTSIKPPPSSEREQLGCWSTMMEDEQLVRIYAMENYLQLDISYTRVPSEARLNKDTKNEHLVFSHLVPYIFPGSPFSPSIQQPPLLEASPLGHNIPPDNQLACFDLLYSMTSSSQPFEWRFLWSPAWNFVGTHLHFTDDLVHLAKGYLGKAFSKPVDDIPPFISIHMRRSDFDSQCDPDEECLIPLGTFHRVLNSMKEEIYFRDGTKIRHILLTSDEDDVEFWKAAKSLGWTNLDHTAAKTAEKYGEWYPPIIDMIAQSLATGFIGTEDSTFSLASSRRVQDWNDGPGVLVSRADRTNLDFISDDF